MSSTDDAKVNELSNLLQKTEVRQENKVSFLGKGLKLNTAEDAKDVIDAINNCVDVQVLELVGNTIGVEACKAIAEALKNKSELQRCLWADMFTGRLRSEIPPALISLGAAISEANANLVEIDLSDNAFGPDGIKSCLALLRSKSAYTLEVLKFNNNGLGIGGKLLAETLIECHKSSKEAGKPLALKVFIAGRNRLENRCAIALAEAFKTIGTLEEIQMPQNGINHEGITALSKSFMHNPNLKHINLNDNTFTKKGAIQMAEAIKNINSLENINFGDCLVRTEGAIAIGQALSNSNPYLKEVNLSFGEVRLEGAIEVCKGLREKEQLCKLNLNGNQFGEDGVEKIEDYAEENGMTRFLEPMDEDEGDSESENDDEGSEEEEATSSEESQSEDIQSIKSATNIPTLNGHSNIKTDIDASQSVLVNLEKDLKNFPSLLTMSHLRVLSLNQIKDILKKAVVVNKTPENFVDDAIKIAGLLSSRIMPPSGNKNPAESPVLDCVDAYLFAAFNKVPETPMIVIDRILIRLGVIKSEDKTITAFPSIGSVGLVLVTALKSSYFPSVTRKTVRAMVAKDNEMWNKHIPLRNRLLELLY